MVAQITNALMEAAALTGPWAPAILFFATFVEHVFPPFPGDLLVVLCAWYAVQGLLSWPAVMLWTTLGAAAGAWVDHRVGVLIGRRLEARAGRSKVLPPERLAAFDAAYQRWGFWVLVFNRFMPGVRAFIFLGAGAAGLPAGRTVLLGSLSAVAWNSLLLGAGALFARNAQELVTLVDRYMTAAGGIVALVVVAFVVRVLWPKPVGR